MVDYPVTIAQLDPATCNVQSNTGTAHIACTRGLICTIENQIKGAIFSTADLLYLNVTVEQLDEIRVNDPNLFNQLLSQHYYKIEKETTSGAKKEWIFYKP